MIVCVCARTCTCIIICSCVVSIGISESLSTVVVLMRSRLLGFFPYLQLALGTSQVDAWENLVSVKVLGFDFSNSNY